MHNIDHRSNLESYASNIQKRYKYIVDFVDQCQTNFRKTRDTNDYCKWDDNK